MKKMDLRDGKNIAEIKKICNENDWLLITSGKYKGKILQAKEIIFYDSLGYLFKTQTKPERSDWIGDCNDGFLDYPEDYMVILKTDLIVR